LTYIVNALGGSLMQKGWFDKPIPVIVGAVKTIHKVSNAREAAHLLINRWPSQGTAVHVRARTLCLAVLHGQQQPNAAREAFAEAAREADVLARITVDISDAMDGGLAFDVPVRIRTGVSGMSSRLVTSVQGAADVLIDWPQSRRGPAYNAARDIVEGAIDGQTTPAEAREAFAAFSDGEEILLEG